MATKKKRSYQRRKRIFIIEMIVLVVLTIIMFVLIWGTHKLSLINKTELDRDRLLTADQYNRDSWASQGGTAEAAVSETGLEGVDVFALIGIDTRDSADGEANSDTMILCVLDHNNKEIRLVSIYRDTYLNIGTNYDGTPDYYDKANAAYCYGGAEQFLSMINLNMDLNVTEYMAINFEALAKAIDIVGGIDIEMTREELIHLNNYNVETSEVCGVPYEAIEVPPAEEFDGAKLRTFHCTGTQAVSYARIRYTQGNDFRRASRQREVLMLLKEKAMNSDMGTIDSLLNAVLPMVTTNIDNGKLLSLATNILSYSVGEDSQAGFPFVHAEDDGTLTGTDCVIPVTLEYNVQLLHDFMFPGSEYYPSGTVQSYSENISYITGYGSSDIESVAAIEDNAKIPGWTEELYQQEQAGVVYEDTGGSEY